MCFTGKSENLAETPVLKDFFILVVNGHHFQKMLVFNGDIEFSYRSIFCFWKVSIFGGIVFF